MLKKHIASKELNQVLGGPVKTIVTANVDVELRRLFEQESTTESVYLGHCDTGSSTVADYISGYESYCLGQSSPQCRGDSSVSRNVYCVIDACTDIEKVEQLNDVVQSGSTTDRFIFVIDKAAINRLTPSVYSRLVETFRYVGPATPDQNLDLVSSSSSSSSSPSKVDGLDDISEEAGDERSLERTVLCEFKSLKQRVVQDSKDPYTIRFQEGLSLFLGSFFKKEGLAVDAKIKLTLEVSPDENTHTHQRMIELLNTKRSEGLYGMQMTGFPGVTLALKTRDEDALEDKLKRVQDQIKIGIPDFDETVFHLTESSWTDISGQLRVKRDGDNCVWDTSPRDVKTLYMNTIPTIRMMTLVADWLAADNSRHCFFGDQPCVQEYGSYEQLAVVKTTMVPQIKESEDVIARLEEYTRYTSGMRPGTVQFGDGIPQYLSKERKYLVLDLEPGDEGILIRDIEEGDFAEMVMTTQIWERITKYGPLMSMDKVFVTEFPKVDLDDKVQFLDSDVLRCKVAYLKSLGYTDGVCLYLAIYEGVPESYRPEGYVVPCLSDHHFSKLIASDTKIVGQRRGAIDRLIGSDQLGTMSRLGGDENNLYFNDNRCVLMEPCCNDMDWARLHRHVGPMVFVSYRDAQKDEGHEEESVGEIQSIHGDLTAACRKKELVLGDVQEGIIDALASDIDRLRQGSTQYERVSRILIGAAGMGKDEITDILKAISEITFLCQEVLNPRLYEKYVALIESSKEHPNQIHILNLQEINLSEAHVRTYERIVMDAMRYTNVYVVGTCNNFAGRASIDVLKSSSSITVVDNIDNAGLKASLDMFKCHDVYKKIVEDALMACDRSMLSYRLIKKLVLVVNDARDNQLKGVLRRYLEPIQTIKKKSVEKKERSLSDTVSNFIYWRMMAMCLVSGLGFYGFWLWVSQKDSTDFNIAALIENSDESLVPLGNINVEPWPCSDLGNHSEIVFETKLGSVQVPDLGFERMGEITASVRERLRPGNMLHEQDNILFGASRSQARLESPTMSFQELSDFLDMVRESFGESGFEYLKSIARNSPDIKTFLDGLQRLYQEHFTYDSVLTSPHPDGVEWRNWVSVFVSTHVGLCAHFAQFAVILVLAFQRFGYFISDGQIGTVILLECGSDQYHERIVYQDEEGVLQYHESTAGVSVRDSSSRTQSIQESTLNDMNTWLFNEYKFWLFVIPIILVGFSYLYFHLYDRYWNKKTNKREEDEQTVFTLTGFVNQTRDLDTSKKAVSVDWSRLEQVERKEKN